MATQTYAQLRIQIATLEMQASKAKKEEMAGVVARIKEAIESYGLTAQDIFGGKAGVDKAKSNSKSGSAVKSKAPVAAKYADGKGGQWVGLGKRPKWLSDALAAGQRLEDFLVQKFESAVDALSSPPAGVVAPAQNASVPSPAKSKKTKSAAAGKKLAISAKYSDGAGNSWSGRGPTPKWLKTAIAGGKAKEDFLAKP